LTIIDNFRETIINLGYSGFNDPLYWKDIKELIVKEQKRLDAISTVEIRNMFVSQMPQEKAFIWFLE
jgi:hypothetical protein